MGVMDVRAITERRAAADVRSRTFDATPKEKNRHQKSSGFFDKCSVGRLSETRMRQLVGCFSILANFLNGEAAKRTSLCDQPKSILLNVELS